MAMDKMQRQTIERLDRIEAKLDTLIDGVKWTPAATPTAEELMAIKGVGSSTADEILKLLGQE